jgi:hypothetical protein
MRQKCRKKEKRRRKRKREKTYRKRRLNRNGSNFLSNAGQPKYFLEKSGVIILMSGLG